ncbi:MAG: regulatory iron-sulfur-containing complex subunit RicT, partial [Calditrichota bacterium]
MTEAPPELLRGPPRGGLVWVEFKGHRRCVFANPYEFPFKPGDTAIVDADRGHDAGLVRFCRFSTSSPAAGPPPVYSVIRRATSQDFERITWLREREKQVIDACRQRIQTFQLAMNLIDAEYRFDGLKLTFFFTAEGRVDFRDLVRELAGSFRTRIELRQIGARDEVKRWDSYGICGRRLCCVNYLQSFYAITTFMAKSQNLILNPGKLSGLCGRLKCCLAYEFTQYNGHCEGSLKDIEDSEELQDLV